MSASLVSMSTEDAGLQWPPSLAKPALLRDFPRERWLLFPRLADPVHLLPERAEQALCSQSEGLRCFTSRSAADP